MTNPTTATVQSWQREHAQRRIRKNAKDLRRLAATFDRIADDLDTVPSPGRALHVEVAAQIVHEHAVWLMNAQLHTAVTYAAAADQAD
jgi:hypothetical protein